MSNNLNESSPDAPGGHLPKEIPVISPIVLKQLLINWMEVNNFSVGKAAEIINVEPATIAGIMAGAPIRNVIRNKLAQWVPGIETIRTEDNGHYNRRSS